jgi:hypothetical protein
VKGNSHSVKIKRLFVFTGGEEDSTPSPEFPDPSIQELV